jgi:hypothetical protein
MSTGIWIAVVALMFCAQTEGTPRRTVADQRAYELYSWSGPDGGWHFSLLPHTSREKSVREVFSGSGVLKGVVPLKRRLSTIRGATVFWVDRLPSGTGPKAKGSEALRLPPPAIVGEIRRHAEACQVTLDVSASPAGG